jgi:hypothetical protein
VDLSGIPKEAYIKWILQKKLNMIGVDKFVAFVTLAIPPTTSGSDSIFRQKVRNVSEGVNTSGVNFKRFFNNGGFFLIHNDGFIPNIVEITDGC